MDSLPQAPLAHLHRTIHYFSIAQALEKHNCVNEGSRSCLTSELPRQAFVVTLNASTRHKLISIRIDAQSHVVSNGSNVNVDSHVSMKPNRCLPKGVPASAAVPLYHLVGHRAEPVPGLRDSERALFYLKSSLDPAAGRSFGPQGRLCLEWFPMHV